MSTRKFESDYSKIQKKMRTHALIVSQKGAMDKFVKIDKKNEFKNRSEYSLNEQDNNNNIDIGENNNRERKI